MLADLLRRLTEQLPPGSGPLGLLSGDEFLPPVAEFDRALLENAGGARIALVLCADHRAATQSARFARKHFETLGAQIVCDDVHGEWGARKEVPDFDVAYLTGGSPHDLLRCLRDDGFWTVLVERWRAGAALAGSSAGAMAMGSHCLTPKPGAHVPTAWEQGAGPLDDVALAVHATTRPKAWLEEIARDSPVPVLALDDRTGVILRANSDPLVTGEGSAWVAE